MIAFRNFAGARRRRVAGFLTATALLCLLGGAAEAAVSWRSIDPVNEVPTRCIKVQAQDFDYLLLDDQEPVVLDLRGPRRLKIVTRYLFADNESEECSYTLRVLMDGQEVLRKATRSRVLAGPKPCRGDGDIGALRKSYLNVPTGRHEIQILVGERGRGRVAARFFRETRREKTQDVAYAPDEFESVRHLQFASGTQSTYYHFTDAKPLRFTVRGPTNLKLYTRLDFDLTMNGAQNYSLELLRNEESQNVYHYHAEKLSAAHYVEREDLLPGDRKLMRITVPPGVQNYELRCLRPQACGIACQIRIPEADVRP